MRLLFLLQPGANSRSIFLDFIRGFRQAGHEALTLELAPIWHAYDQNPAARPALMSRFTGQLREALVAQRIDLTCAMWGNALTTLMHSTHDGAPRTLFDLLNIPHLLFWLDAPHWAQGGSMLPAFGTPILAGPALRHLINNPATAREMTDVLGFGATIAAPYAINEEVFRPRPEITPEFDLVACIGPGDPAPTPLALRELESSTPDLDALRREAADLLRPRLRELAGNDASAAALDALLDSQVAARHIPMLDRLRAIDTDIARAILADPRLYTRATMANRSIESLERPFTTAWLSRRFSCAIFGEGDLSAWGFRGAHLGRPAHEEQSAAYARGRIGLNLMRWQDDAGLNLKPYEISASGRSCLCSARAWTDRSFEPGREILAFSGPAHAAQLTRELLDDPARLTAIAEAGLARTRRDHTWCTRAAQIIDSL
ncbi:MAG: glycosyltransferase family 1 protein [Phycisphaerales bacterium]|nr:glycosyltransferase family 1 protein [Phycisphaerales bacterium]